MNSTTQIHLQKFSAGEAEKRVMISYLPLKLLYTAMLDELPVFDVREFWDSQIEKGILRFSRKSDLYFSLWNSNDQIDFENLCSILNNIEHFASKKGLSIHDLVLKAIKQARIVEQSAQALLCICAPVIEHLFRPKDMREQILKAAVFLSGRITTGLANPIISHCTLGDFSYTIFALMIADTYDRRKYGRSLPSFNIETWAAYCVKNMPILLSLEPLEEYFMLADSREISDIVPSASIVDNMLLINGEKYGKVNSFHDLCKKKSVMMKIHAMGIPDDLIIEVEKNYLCPTNNTILLHKGCSYGAPVAIYGFKYRRLHGKPKHSFSEFVKTATGNSCSASSRIQEKHSILMDSLQPVTRLVYHSNNDSISLNGRHLVKSVPAQILKHLLLAYKNDLKTTFEYKEFLKNKEIVVDTSNPNIAVRVQRLSQVLKKNFPQVKIIMLGRGKFRLQVDCKLHFSLD